jgi:hypothetical protein
MLPDTLDEMMTKSASYMETWVHHTRAPLNKALDDARRLAKNNQHDLRKFFQHAPATVPHPPPNNLVTQPPLDNPPIRLPRYRLALDSIRRARDIARRMRQNLA